MGVELPGKLFRHDDGQAVTIPHGLELPGEHVFVRQEGNRLVIEPAQPRRRTLSELLASWDPLDERLAPIDDTPPRPVEL